MSFGPECPRCGEPVPYLRARGRPFPCKHCGQRLIAPKAGALAAIGILMLMFALRDRFADYAFGWSVPILVVVLIGVAEYLLLKVSAVGNGER